MSIRQHRIAGPLGLHSTRFDTAAAGPVGNLAAGWSDGLTDGDPTDPYEAIASSAWAAGALVSTTDELATFLAALFAGELLSDAGLAAMTDLGDHGYGLGIAGGPDFAFGPGRPGFGHSGALPGYKAHMSIQPDSGDTLVILANNEYINMNSLTSRILDAAW